MTADAPLVNGHATIREVYTLTAKVRDELLEAMEKMEGRLLQAIHENREERQMWIKTHEERHEGLDTRHSGEDREREKRQTQRQMLLSIVSFLDKHWKALVAGGGISVALTELVSRWPF